MNVDKILDRFSQDVKGRFLKLSRVLEESEKYEGFENDVAILILDLMDRAKLDEKFIMESSFLIANAFSDYEFDERISHAIRIFSELQIPIEFQEGREFEMWNKARDYLLKFLDDEGLYKEKIEIVDLD